MLKEAKVVTFESAIFAIVDPLFFFNCYFVSSVRSSLSCNGLTSSILHVPSLQRIAGTWFFEFRCKTVTIDANFG